MGKMTVSKKGVHPQGLKIVCFIGLIILGLLGNYYRAKLFLGVDFIFGSVAALLAARFYGPLWGGIAGAAIGSYTWVLWSHPYAMIIFTVEAALVGWVRQRHRQSLLLLDGLYWLVVGSLLVALFYGALLQVGVLQVQLILLKQALNGVCNALIASGILGIFSFLGQRFPQRFQSVRWPLRDVLNDILVAFVLLPIMLLFTLDANRMLVDLERSVRTDLQLASAPIIEQIRNWQRQIWETATDFSQLKAESLTEAQLITALEQNVLIDGLWVLDSKLRFLTQATNNPDVSLSLQSLSQLELRESQPNQLQSWRIVAIPKDKTGDEHQLWLVRPLTQGLESTGFLIAHLRFDRFIDALTSPVKIYDQAVGAVLVNENQQVMGSVNPAYEPQDSFNLSQPKTWVRQLGTSSAEFYQVLTNDPARPPMVRARQSTYWLDSILPGDLGWHLWISFPAQPHMDDLQVAYNQRFGIVMLVVYGSMLAAYWVSKALVKPLQILAKITTDLPDRVNDQQDVDWPQSPVQEFDQLSTNGQLMAESLRERFLEIHQANEQLEQRVAERTEDLEATLSQLKQTQTQLVQTEKMSSLGGLVAGVAHEINNPINFIAGNLTHAEEYVQSLLKAMSLFDTFYPDPEPTLREALEELELDFLVEDLPKTFQSMQLGARRVQDIVQSLRTFSRIDRAELQTFDLHEGIDSTLIILQNRLKGRSDRLAIEVIKQYGPLPLVECYGGHLNQVFMNLLVNAIDAIDLRDAGRTLADMRQNPSRIEITTATLNQQLVIVRFRDNGPGMPPEVRDQIFEPFFTTKPTGKGTGLGLSISYQVIVEQHGGALTCQSSPDWGTEFYIELPICGSTKPKNLQSNQDIANAYV